MKLTTEQIERHIDATSLTQILNELETICLMKADHIETNWQDRITAKAWRQWENKFHHLAAQAHKQDL